MGLEHGESHVFSLLDYHKIDGVGEKNYFTCTEDQKIYQRFGKVAVFMIPHNANKKLNLLRAMRMTGS